MSNDEHKRQMAALQQIYKQQKELADKIESTEGKVNVLVFFLVILPVALFVLAALLSG